MACTLQSLRPTLNRHEFKSKRQTIMRETSNVRVKIRDVYFLRRTWPEPSAFFLRNLRNYSDCSRPGFGLFSFAPRVRIAFKAAGSSIDSRRYERKSFAPSRRRRVVVISDSSHQWGDRIAIIVLSTRVRRT